MYLWNYHMTAAQTLRDDYGVTTDNISYYSNLTGIPEVKLHEILTGEAKITRQISKQLCTALGIHRDDYFLWLYKQNQKERATEMKRIKQRHLDYKNKG